MKGKKYSFSEDAIIECLYRPFNKMKLYYSKELNEMRYQVPSFFPKGTEKTPFISFNSLSSKPFAALASNSVCDLHLIGDSQCIPLFIRAQSKKKSNITDWGLLQFRKHYKSKDITKEKIFHYVYGVLHDPVYRKKYELNLKREFPRIPFYKNFKQWSEWGKELMELHISYEKAPFFSLKRTDITPEKNSAKKSGGKSTEKISRFAYNPDPKPKLKADKSAGTIELDDVTTLTGVPAEAWEYKLGNRSALEWILDQYKEKKPSDPTIAEKFNTYRFADYKEQVVGLLKRVTTVSVRTMAITGKMKDAER